MWINCSTLLVPLKHPSVLSRSKSPSLFSFFMIYLDSIFFWCQGLEESWDLASGMVCAGELGPSKHNRSPPISTFIGTLGAAQHRTWEKFISSSAKERVFPHIILIFKIQDCFSYRPCVSRNIHFQKHPFVTKRSGDSSVWTLIFSFSLPQSDNQIHLPSTAPKCLKGNYLEARSTNILADSCNRKKTIPFICYFAALQPEHSYMHRAGLVFSGTLGYIWMKHQALYQP